MAEECTANERYSVVRCCEVNYIFASLPVELDVEEDTRIVENYRRTAVASGTFLHDRLNMCESDCVVTRAWSRLREEGLIDHKCNNDMYAEVKGVRGDIEKMNVFISRSRRQFKQVPPINGNSAVCRASQTIAVRGVANLQAPGVNLLGTD
ncbi:hypothetical protein J6590_041811 [Homalodisca vitripennis]|nr:hypothetical protein J6590_041811 [Homalodisca vitripennis]